MQANEIDSIIADEFGHGILKELYNDGKGGCFLEEIGEMRSRDISITKKEGKMNICKKIPKRSDSQLTGYDAEDETEENIL
jgi:hypothetical protein